jgi:hypothetical protein
VKLNPIGKEEPADERMRRKRKSSEEEGEEKYPESCGWSRNDFRPGDLDFYWIILQDADLCVALPVLLQELGLDPIAHRGRIGGLGLAFFAAAPMAEELLMPMTMALKQALTGNGSKDVR